MAYDLIVFDWDGTLMDSAARIVASLRAAGEEMALEAHPDQALRNIIGLGMFEAIRALHPELSPNDQHRFADHYRHHFLEACPQPEALFDGVHEMLQQLCTRPELFLAVATGKSRKGLDRVLADTGCKGYFHSTRCADETCSKPDPQMLRELMDELGVEPQRTLMIGDTEYDLEMAQRAGSDSLAVTYGAHEVHRLQAYKTVATHHSVAELHAWLARRLEL